MRNNHDKLQNESRPTNYRDNYERKLNMKVKIFNWGIYRRKDIYKKRKKIWRNNEKKYIKLI